MILASLILLLFHYNSRNNYWGKEKNKSIWGSIINVRQSIQSSSSNYILFA